MIWAEHLLIDLERPLVGCLGPRVIAQRSQHPAQVVDANSHVGMVGGRSSRGVCAITIYAVGVQGASADVARRRFRCPGEPVLRAKSMVYDRIVTCLVVVARML